MYMQYDVNIISLLVLAVVLFNNVKNGGENTNRPRLFRLLVICDMLLLALDALILIISEYKGPAVHTALWILQGLFFFFCSLFCLFWAFFCTNRHGRRIKPRGFFVLNLPLLVLTVFLVLNIWDPVVYGFTEANTYFRGSYFHVTSAATYIYVIYSLMLTVRNKHNLERREYYPYLIVPILPIAFGILQLIFFINVQIVWPSVAVGLLLMQLYALDEKMSIDHLTGLYNRKHLDNYVKDILESSNTSFAALMLDIDNFKVINDNFGHVQGDRAIVSASILLKRSVRRGDFVARYGGDEFMIILDRCSPATLEHVINRIKENVARYNKENRIPYRLDFSIGCKIFSDTRGLTTKDVFAKIDELMYKNKQGKEDNCR